jgi:hypothetical protein
MKLVENKGFGEWIGELHILVQLNTVFCTGVVDFVQIENFYYNPCEENIVEEHVDSDHSGSYAEYPSTFFYFLSKKRIKD